MKFRINPLATDPDYIRFFIFVLAQHSNILNQQYFKIVHLHIVKSE